MVSLPYGWQAGRRIASRGGARHIELGLPIELDGTACWLRKVAESAGCLAEVKKYIGERLREIVPTISSMVARVFAGRRVLVIADPALAPGLKSYLEELGMEVIGPIFRCRRRDSIPPGF